MLGTVLSSAGVRLNVTNKSHPPGAYILGGSHTVSRKKLSHTHTHTADNVSIGEKNRVRGGDNGR